MKTALTRLSLALIISLALIQIPFIYRRAGFSELAEKVATLKRAPAPAISPADANFTEHQGVFHVHTSLGGHSTGSFDELVIAAVANDLDFVIMTEHWSDLVDTARLTPDGQHGKTLFIAGNEIDTGETLDRLLTVPGSQTDGSGALETKALIERIRAEGRLAFVTYPEKFSAWDSEFDGMEVFSLHTNAQQASRLTAILDVVWSYPSYPEQVLMHYFARPVDNLKRFDEIASKRKISLIAGADAHSNIGFHFFGDDAGHELLSFKLDEYSTIFRLVRQHVLLSADQEMNSENLLAAIKNGRSFIGLDALAPTTGFRFGSADGRHVMGDQIELSEAGGGPKLRAGSPIPGRFAVYRNGEPFFQSEKAAEIDFVATQPGSYRVEVYLDELGPPFDQMPWIMSNPIFVQAGQ